MFLFLRLLSPESQHFQPHLRDPMFDETQRQHKKQRGPIEHSYYFKYVPIYLLIKTHKSLLNKREKKKKHFYQRPGTQPYTSWAGELQMWKSGTKKPLSGKCFSSISGEGRRQRKKTSSVEQKEKTVRKAEELNFSTRTGKLVTSNKNDRYSSQ